MQFYDGNYTRRRDTLRPDELKKRESSRWLLKRVGWVSIPFVTDNSTPSSLCFQYISNTWTQTCLECLLSDITIDLFQQSNEGSRAYRYESKCCVHLEEQTFHVFFFLLRGSRFEYHEKFYGSSTLDADSVPRKWQPHGTSGNRFSNKGNFAVGNLLFIVSLRLRRVARSIEICFVFLPNPWILWSESQTDVN